MARSNLSIQFSPMLYLLFISFVPLILIPHMIKLWSLWFCGEFSRTTMIITRLRKWIATRVVEEEEEEERERTSSAASLLDLPDLALDCILERLSPEALRAMSGVCVSLRDTCTSDHLWERHWRGKWGRVIGESNRRNRREWLSESRSEQSRDERERGGLFRCLVDSFPFSPWMIEPNEEKKKKKLRTDLPLESAMASYLSLESGNFWFPAQVYNRESGHIGFMLSCYDAHLCYDSKTDTFEARYSPQGRRSAEENVEWERLRAAPVETHPFTLHVSDCLRDLRPGDHVEIQWRRNKEFPYGWWYGVVAHSKTCDAGESLCLCHHSDTVVLEFKQYNLGSKWRQTTVNRKDHREEGNTVDGFYGGIRKLYNAEEILRWNHFWPAQTLEQ